VVVDLRDLSISEDRSTMTGLIIDACDVAGAPGKIGMVIVKTY
jgi:hypothetical protein